MKKLLSVILCAVLLTGVCTAAYAAKSGIGRISETAKDGLFEQLETKAKILSSACSELKEIREKYFRSNVLPYLKQFREVTKGLFQVDYDLRRSLKKHESLLPDDYRLLFEAIDKAAENAIPVYQSLLNKSVHELREYFTSEHRKSMGEWSSLIDKYTLSKYRDVFVYITKELSPKLNNAIGILRQLRNS